MIPQKIKAVQMNGFYFTDFHTRFESNLFDQLEFGY